MKLASVGFMREYAPHAHPIDLTLATPATPSNGAALPAQQPGDSGSSGGSPQGQDRYLLRAIREHASGSIDPALWAHAMAQARDDRQLATRLYLNSRATALRVEKRNDEVVKRAGVVEALSKEPEHLAGEAPPTTTPVASAQASVRGGLLSRRKHLIAVAGVAGGIIIAVVAFLALRSGSSLPQPANAARAVAAARAIAPKTAIPKAPEVSAEDFAAKIRVQKEAGNWNLLVINASEWARRQPSNLDAWKELSVGYVKLRQWNDALDATKKAADLAPDDLLLWQTLGQVNMELKRPVDALEAFQRATAINERDVGSWVQQGVLNMQIRRLPDAKVAFERALAVSPGDTEALCGAASLAQKEEREKDALALNRQVAAAGARCPEPPPVESTVVKSTQAPAKPARKPH